MKLIAESRRRLPARRGAARSLRYRRVPVATAGEQGAGAVAGSGPYPRRTIIEVDRLNQDDITTVLSTRHKGGGRRRSIVAPLTMEKGRDLAAQRNDWNLAPPADPASSPRGGIYSLGYDAEPPSTSP
jgi:hypothetical protein